MTGYDVAGLQTAGVDEAGRGPLAGPGVAAAVILPDGFTCAGLTDSKRMSLRQREQAYDQICTAAISWHIASASVSEIDQVNILQATMLAMQRAVAGLHITPDRALIDGNRCPDLPIPCQAVVRGDSLVLAISEASVLAKVWRDRLLDTLDEQYPQYGFGHHKGYGTPAHLQALAAHGPTPAHRLTFAPVRRAMLAHRP